jgi:hypothetical protein
MIRGYHDTFSKDQAVTANAASTNQIDLGVARDLALGARPMYVVVQCTEQMADTGNNSNCTVYLRTDADVAMGSPTNCQTLGVFATNSAVGTRLIQVLQPVSTDERYLDLYYSMGGGDLSAGKFTAYLTPDPDLQQYYPNNYTISTT